MHNLRKCGRAALIVWLEDVWFTYANQVSPYVILPVLQTLRWTKEEKEHPVMPVKNGRIRMAERSCLMEKFKELSPCLLLPFIWHSQFQSWRYKCDHQKSVRLAPGLERRMICVGRVWHTVGASVQPYGEGNPCCCGQILRDDKKFLQSQLGRSVLGSFPSSRNKMNLVYQCSSLGEKHGTCSRAQRII